MHENSLRGSIGCHRLNLRPVDEVMMVVSMDVRIISKHFYVIFCYGHILVDSKKGSDSGV